VRGGALPERVKLRLRHGEAVLGVGEVESGAVALRV
jgi:hypothetical protein